MTTRQRPRTQRSKYGLKMDRNRRSTVIVCEDLDFTFCRNELKEIAYLWNEGINIDDIAKRYDREPDEIALAIMHLKRNDKVKAANSRNVAGYL